MNKANEIFLTIFKDLVIERDPAHPGTDDLPNYKCSINGEFIKNKMVMKMVKDYQEAIIESLLS